MSRADASRDDWFVSQEGGNVHAKLYTDISNEPLGEWPKFSTGAPVAGDNDLQKPHLFSTEDGWLAVYNRGEFGSSLWWYSLDGKIKYQISEHWVNGFIQHKNRIFAVEGRDSPTSSEGSLIELAKLSGKWTATQIVELPGAGLAVTVLPDDRFCIVTSEMLLAVSLEKRTEVLVPNGHWIRWYPNSITTDAECRNVYIGMRQFVVRYPLGDNEHRAHLLVPAQSFLNTND
ncbi:hypothetical protein [Roseimicrobium gellanilyticum]|uniref:hypothetical protein n=1 Tax=Roseimicrobium gellanilyticum TaxID=748857 RepID=UPI0011BD4E0B|nr:hypothetical protein [Roseimicrobium gellanilyticum]